MIIDLAGNDGCNVFVATTDSSERYVSFSPLGGSLFEVLWHSDAADAAQAGAGSVPGVADGAWLVYGGEYPDCVIPDGVEPDGVNLRVAAGSSSTGNGGGGECLVAPGGVYQPPAAKAVTVVWQATTVAYVPFEGTYKPAAADIDEGKYTPEIPEAVSIWGISKPECCEITVTHSAGTVVIPANTTNYTAEFNQDVDLRPFSLSGDCLTETTLFVQHP